MTRIRKATGQDVPALLHLLTAMAAEVGETAASTEATLHTHGFGPNPRFQALLAEGDAGPIGLIIYFPEYSTWRGQLGLFVQDIYVCPEGRGLGLGRTLLAAALDQADWNPQFLSLMVAHENTAARAFYESLGMELRDQADQLILKGEGLAALQAR